jgi:hypothetical protein
LSADAADMQIQANSSEKGVSNGGRGPGARGGGSSYRMEPAFLTPALPFSRRPDAPPWAPCLTLPGPESSARAVRGRPADRHQSPFRALVPRPREVVLFCGAAWQAACRLGVPSGPGTRGDCQSPRRMPSCPTEIAPFLTVTVPVHPRRRAERWCGCKRRLVSSGNRFGVGTGSAKYRRSPHALLRSWISSPSVRSNVFTP